MGVYYDFASTLCFVAHRVVERIAPELRTLGVRLRWTPIDLTRLTGWQRGRPLPPEGRRRAEIVSADLGVRVRHVPRHWLDSRPASELALTLPEELEESFRFELWAAVYDAGASLDRDLLETLQPESASLPPAFPLVEEETRRAQALGVAGVPSFVLGEWPVGGIQDDATMLHFLGRYAQKKRGHREN